MQARARWIFGYGSLIWRPDFAYLEKRAACVRGLARRLWQGSPDHRGAPDAPGRVATLVPRRAARCWGVAYRVADGVWDAVLARLDARESGGFERCPVDVGFADSAQALAPALTYIAHAHNPNFLGPAPLAAIADQVRRASGRSGSNAAYVLELAAALRALAVRDAHVFGVAARLSAEVG
ncbi:MAG: gamma-glutamylcyclotransferase [Myxococcales bacterium]|nr:gamma-glutamylcyclotransferase [Myxococcales bacterium]MDH5307114.1 gamma-glutamylcyclotransferase [Myxococcales bacterium]MDH5565073.1 gamma-glutamylcyclotransferase [Myxococcales bacterium]